MGQSNPSSQLLFSRFDQLAATGLPIWVTEYDMVEPDDNLRADKLEMFLK